MLASSSAGGHVFRTLREEDIPGVKALCLDCFPVEYSDKWFMYVTSSKVYSLGCFLPDDDTIRGNDQLISMVIGEEQPLIRVEKEVGPILASARSLTTVMYIISLGVLSQHRKQGLGSLLVNSLLAHVSSIPSCQAVYLHVQASNSSAQRFYNQLSFREFTTVQDYYWIQGKYEDAFLYCCYTNGGVAFTPSWKGYTFRYYEAVSNCLWDTCSVASNSIRKFLHSIRHF